MRKDLKKRLEKAITTLKEPGGSTIRSIIKVINKDNPVLSLRKVLEALQEGINEGFLCMYNGRVKLKKYLKNEEDSKKKSKDVEEESEAEVSESNNESEFFSEEDEDVQYSSEQKSKKGLRRNSEQERFRYGRNRRHGDPLGSKKFDQAQKKIKRRTKKDHRKGEFRNYQLSLDKAECDSLLEMSAGMPEKKYARPAAEKPDLKKQRGPRCTSMKKDIRMPSKVHLPFVPPSPPQKTNIFNDLLRRSPEPVNGPLFDGFILTPENVSFC